MEYTQESNPEIWINYNCLRVVLHSLYSRELLLQCLLLQYLLLWLRIGVSWSACLDDCGNLLLDHCWVFAGVIPECYQFIGALLGEQFFCFLEVLYKGCISCECLGLFDLLSNHLSDYDCHIALWLVEELLKALLFHDLWLGEVGQELSEGCVNVRNKLSSPCAILLGTHFNVISR